MRTKQKLPDSITWPHRHEREARRKGRADGCASMGHTAVFSFAKRAAACSDSARNLRSGKQYGHAGSPGHRPAVQRDCENRWSATFRLALGAELCVALGVKGRVAKIKAGAFLAEAASQRAVRRCDARQSQSHGGRDRPAQHSPTKVTGDKFDLCDRLPAILIHPWEVLGGGRRSLAASDWGRRDCQPHLPAARLQSSG